MSTAQDDTTFSSSIHLEAYTSFDWWFDSQRTKQGFSNVLLQGMESIVSCGQRIFAAPTGILNDDAR